MSTPQKSKLALYFERNPIVAVLTSLAFVAMSLVVLVFPEEFRGGRWGWMSDDQRRVVALAGVLFFGLGAIVIAWRAFNRSRTPDAAPTAESG